MFSSRVRGGKAYPSKKKIREFKTILFISKECIEQRQINVLIQRN